MSLSGRAPGDRQRKVRKSVGISHSTPCASYGRLVFLSAIIVEALSWPCAIATSNCQLSIPECGQFRYVHSHRRRAIRRSTYTPSEADRRRVADSPDRPVPRASDRVLQTLCEARSASSFGSLVSSKDGPATVFLRSRIRTTLNVSRCSHVENADSARKVPILRNSCKNASWVRSSASATFPLIILRHRA